MMKKLCLVTLGALCLTGCETLDSVKGGFSDAGHWLTGKEKTASLNCPHLTISEDLNSYLQLPERTDHSASANAVLATATMDKIQGSCALDQDNDLVTINIDIEFTATPGPSNTAAQGSDVLEAPYFVAVLDAGQNILSKNTFLASISTPDNNKNEPMSLSEHLRQSLPAEALQTPEKYTIIAGFQLSDAQLAYAKTQKAVATIKPAAGGTIGPDPFAER